MCELSPNQVASIDSRNCLQMGMCTRPAEHRLPIEPNSLFRNILEVSRCESIFCPDPTIPISSKSLRMNILREPTKKINSQYSPPVNPRLPSACTVHSD